MSFLADLERARVALEQHGRLSLRALARELGFDGEVLDELVDELVDVQRVAARDGNVLVWTGRAAVAPAAIERAARAYTPQHLTERVLQSRAALEGERKQVTVLFADVKDSMALASTVGEEAWHGILDRFFAILTEGIHRFEGTVNQYTGDGVMALFGAPIAHEDHAQRACFAALHLRDGLRAFSQALRREHGLDFATRIGLNSGEVVVGRIGDDLRMDYTAQGHTVGLAQRMEQLAEAGRIYVAPDTARRVAGYFQLADLGEFRVKGVADALRVAELEGVGALRTRFDASRQRGLSRFVGRADDLSVLESARVRAEAGQGQVVAVGAEPGTGKSRLCFEFLERCRARGVAVVEAQALSHMQSVPFFAAAQLLRASFGLEERTDAAAARERIAGRLLLLDEGLRPSLPLVYDFLGVADPREPRAEISAETRERHLVEVVRRLARTSPMRVVLIEDLHWLDAESERFLAQWVEAVAGAPSLLVVNFRPEYRAGWLSRGHVQRLALAPLSVTAFGELLAAELGTHPSVAALSASLHARTAGNPFFAEEMLQTLVESGRLTGSRGAYVLTRPDERVDLPASVQSVLAARIDRLADTDKTLLATAAIAGKEFSEPLLAAVTAQPAAALSAALARLAEREFIYPIALYPTAVWSFRHPLTQEVALSSQLGERRARVHAAVADALVALGAGQQDERAEEIALHYEAAERWVEAATWHGHASRRLENQGALARSADVVRRAIDCADRAGDAPRAVGLAVRARVGLMVSFWRSRTGTLADVEQVFAEAAALCRDGREPEQFAALLAQRGVAAWLFAQDNEARLAYALEGCAVARRAGTAGGFLEAAAIAAFALNAKGMVRECTALLMDLPDPADIVAGTDTERFYAGALSQRAVARAWAGDAAGALDDLRECERIVAGAPGVFGGPGANGFVEVSLAAGDGADAVARVRTLLARIEQVEHNTFHDWYRAMLARGLQLMEERDAARALVGSMGRETHWLVRGVTSMLIDDPVEMESVARQDLRWAEARKMHRIEIESRLALAHALVAQGRTDDPEVAACFASVAALIDHTGLAVMKVALLEEQAHAARARGDGDAADALLRAALAVAEATGAYGHAARLRARAPAAGGDVLQ